MDSLDRGLTEPATRSVVVVAAVVVVLVRVVVAVEVAVASEATRAVDLLDLVVPAVPAASVALVELAVLVAVAQPLTSFLFVLWLPTRERTALQAVRGTVATGARRRHRRRSGSLPTHCPSALAAVTHRRLMVTTLRLRRITPAAVAVALTTRPPER